MPGFNICGTGAQSETRANGKIETRRKYRWVLQIDKLGNRAWAYAKTANRPKMSLGTIEQHHNQEKIWHMGKTTWNDLTVTFYDIEQQPDMSKEIFDWLNKNAYSVNQANAHHPSFGGGAYKQDVSLKMLDHLGSPAGTDNWKYCNAWPYDVDWGGLDYSADDLCEITAIIKYDRAQKV